VIVKKLGWGHFSTVWMARDDHYNNNSTTKHDTTTNDSTTSQAPSRARYVALKVRAVIHAYYICLHYLL
jgi:hypothetical protein